MTFGNLFLVAFDNVFAKT